MAVEVALREMVVLVAEQMEFYHQEIQLRHLQIQEVDLVEQMVVVHLEMVEVEWLF